MSAAPGPAPPQLPRFRRRAGSFPLLAGARLPPHAALPQPAAAATNPRLTHFPAGAGGVDKVSGGCSLLVTRLRGSGSGGPAQAPEPPPRRTLSGSRLAPFPARHAQRARPRRESAREQGWGRARVACASALPGAGLPPAEPGRAGRFPRSPAPATGRTRPLARGAGKSSLAARGGGAFQLHRYVPGQLDVRPDVTTG